MKAHAVILNPRANGGNGAKRWTALLETEAARRAGLAGAALFDGGGCVDPKRVEGRLEAWLSERLRAGARNFVAAGGDGTVHLALNALLSRPERAESRFGEIRLGAVALGSSNDFHKPHSIAGRAEAAGLRCRLDFAGARAHDVGRVEYSAAAEGTDVAGGAAGTRHFLINASIGVTAEANGRFNAGRGLLGPLKRYWVDGAIVATALQTFAGYRNFQVRLSIEGSGEREVALTNLGIVKNPHFSGQMRYDLPCAPDDGRFGVHLCEGMSRLEMIQVLSALSAGRFQGIPKTESVSATTVRVRAAAPGRTFSLETDGEVTPVASASFKILPREVHACP